MDIKRKSKILQKKVVYIGFAFVIIKYSFASTIFILPEIINIALMFLAMLFMTFHIAINKISFNQLAVFILSLFISIIFYLLNGYNDNLIILILASFSLKDIDLDQLLKVFVITVLIILVFTICYSLITGRGMGRYEAFRMEVGEEYRYMFGFSHPNAMHGMYFKLLCGIIMRIKKQYKKLRKNILILLEIINVVFFCFTNSRTGFISITLMLLMAYYEDVVIKLFHRKTILYIASGIIVNTIILTIFAVLNCRKYSILSRLDVLLTGRLSLAYRYFSQYSIKIFGTNISTIDGHFYIDCGIANTLFEYGIIAFVIIVLIYLGGTYSMWKQYNYTGMIIVVAITVYSITENIYINIFMNIGFLLCIWNLLQGRLKLVLYNLERVILG